MEYQSVGIFVIFGILVTGVDAGHDYVFADQMRNYCGKQLSMMSHKEYQLELELTDNYLYSNNLSGPSDNPKHSCDVTVAAWHIIYPKMVIHFDDLEIDCKDGHLEFYMGQTAETRVKGLENNICGWNRPKGSFTVDAPYLYIRYVPAKSQYIKDVFSVTITAFTDGTCPSNSRKCSNSYCIDKRLDCDDIVSDADSSEDDDFDDDVTNVAGIIGVVIGGLCVLGVIICMIVCCICCKRTTRKTTVVENQYQHSPVTVTSTGQPHGYSQPIYNVGQGLSYQTMQPSYAAPSSGQIPTAPETTTLQYGYQGPGELFSYDNIPMSPPPYAEIFGQHGDKEAPPLSEKQQQQVHVELDNAKA